MTQQNILELAKQGNAQAIAALMNRLLTPKGIAAKVSFKDDCLRVLFESEDVPPEKDLVNFAFQVALKLNLEPVSVIKVFGRQLGEEMSTWSQELDLDEMIENLEGSLAEPEEDAPPERSHLEAALEPEQVFPLPLGFAYLNEFRQSSQHASTLFFTSCHWRSLTPLLARPLLY